MSENGPLSAVLAEYLQAVDAGQAPDRGQILAQHPELAEQLRTFFARQDALFPPAGAAASGGFPSPFGPYTLLGEVGRGGMGVVYRARHEGLGRVVALKVLTGGAGIQAGGRDRFEQESQTLARLDHPGIVPVYEVGEHDGQAFFSMKLIEGPDLRTRLAALRETLTEGVAVLVAVCRAVQFAHEKGIIHRDLKPANVLLDAEEGVFVTDFGLAHRLDQDLCLTATGALVGTPAYMAPEQVSGETKVGPQADVWALGVILYELLTGRLPFRGETPLETLHLVQNGLKVRPRDVEPGVDLTLERICLCCLQQHPDDRYRSAAALADDLERWLTHGAVSTPRRNRLRLLRRWLRRLKKQRLLATVVAALVLASCGWLVNRELRGLEVDRAEQAAAQGRLEPARALLVERPSWWTFAAGVDGRRERLRLLLDEHLYGDLDGLDSPVTLGWSAGGRWLGGGDRIKDESARDGWRPSLIWDGWTGEPQTKAVTWWDARLRFDERADSSAPPLLKSLTLSNLQLSGGDGWLSLFDDELRLDWRQQGEELVQAARKNGWFHPLPRENVADIRALAVPGEKKGFLRFILMPHNGWFSGGGLRNDGSQAAADLAIDLAEHFKTPRDDVAWSADDRFLHFWQPYRDLQSGRTDPQLSPLIQATYDIKRGRWVRLVDADLRVYEPADEKSATSSIPPDVAQCTPLGRPGVLAYLAGRSVASQAVVLKLSPDGTRLLTVWRRDGAAHVWRMPGSEVGR